MRAAFHRTKLVVRIWRDIFNDVVQHGCTSLTFVLVAKAKHVVILRDNVSLASDFGKRGVAKFNHLV